MASVADSALASTLVGASDGTGGTHRDIIYDNMRQRERQRETFVNFCLLSIGLALAM